MKTIQRISETKAGQATAAIAGLVIGFSGSSVELINKNRPTLEDEFSFNINRRNDQSYLRPLLHSADASFQKNFVIPMVYSAYIVGGGDVNRLLKKFLEEEGGKTTKFVRKNPTATTEISTHQFGNTFDVTKTRVVNPQGEREWSNKFVAMLREILVNHQENGELMALEENATFHNMTATPIFGEEPSTTK